LLVRFRVLPGLTMLGFVAIAVPAVFVSGREVWPMVAGFLLAGVVAEACVTALGKPTLGRAAASVTGALIGLVMWSAVFGALELDGRLAWSESLWGGSILLSGMVGAAVAALVALPVPTGRAMDDGVPGPHPI
jgi:hypothetical protein